MEPYDVVGAVFLEEVKADALWVSSLTSFLIAWVSGFGSVHRSKWVHPFR